MSTVVFQGAITAESLQSIARSIKRLKAISENIQIIVSTWRSSPIEDVGQDLILYAEDPGSYTPIGFKPCNVHRQILTTFAGVVSANPGSCAKLRTDIEIIDAKRFLLLLEKQNAKARTFKRRITAIDYSSVDPLRNNLPLLYHVCDWVFLGEREDILKLFSVPIPMIEYFTKYQNGQPNIRLRGYSEALRAEAYITSFSVAQHYWRLLETKPSISRFSAIRSNLAIAKDFDILKLSEIGLRCIKHNEGAFNPNRLNAKGIKLWADIPRQGIQRRLRKMAIALYYQQSLLFSLLRFIKGLKITSINK